MTGEMTLRGSVLPVGGIKEKILAAKRQGINNIILSTNNEKEIKQIKDDYMQGLAFHYVSRVEDVTELALEEKEVMQALNVNNPEFALQSSNGIQHQPAKT